MKKRGRGEKEWLSMLTHGTRNKLNSTIYIAQHDWNCLRIRESIVDRYWVLGHEWRTNDRRVMPNWLIIIPHFLLVRFLHAQEFRRIIINHRYAAGEPTLKMRRVRKCKCKQFAMYIICNSLPLLHQFRLILIATLVSLLSIHSSICFWLILF